MRLIYKNILPLYSVVGNPSDTPTVMENNINAEMIIGILK